MRSPGDIARLITEDPNTPAHGGLRPGTIVMKRGTVIEADHIAWNGNCLRVGIKPGRYEKVTHSISTLAVGDPDFYAIKHTRPKLRKEVEEIYQLHFSRIYHQLATDLKEYLDTYDYSHTDYIVIRKFHNILSINPVNVDTIDGIKIEQWKL